MIVDFSKYPKSWDICLNFANNQNHNYGKRGQGNENAIRDQIFYGKLAECAAYLYLKSKNIKTNKPDFKIYSKNNKSWDHDLKSDTQNFAVKGQEEEMAQRYGYSWVFQKDESRKVGYDEEIFDNAGDNDYCIFVTIDLKHKTGLIQAVIRTKDLIAGNLFEEMKKVSLRGNKKAVYLESLNKNISQLCQI